MKNYFDPYYADVNQLLGPQFLKPSGWLNYDNSKLENKGSLDYFSYGKDLPFVPENSDVWVVLATGSFHPLHEGHIESVLKVANHLQAINGYSPLIILSPSNQAYLKYKLGPKFQCDEIRKHYLLREIKDTPIFADFWELTPSYELNFTDVIEHIQMVASQLYHKPISRIKVVYTFGSDNAEFCDVFVSRGYCACVNRPGSELKYSSKKSQYSGTQRHLFIEGPLSSVSSSSRGNIISVPRPVFDSHQSPCYFLRDDSFLYSAEYDSARFNSFKESFVALLSEIHSNVQVLDAKVQYREIGLLTSKKACLNLDSVTHGATDLTKSHNISVTRLFGVNDGQFSPIKLTSRNSRGVLEGQSVFKGIPRGEYCFVDDDIASGATFNLMKEAGALQGIYFSESISLLHHCFNISNEFLDVIDLRDFMPSSFFKMAETYAAGLTVKDPVQGIQRIPYLDPRVDLFTRAKIPFEVQSFFRQEMKKLHGKLIQRSP